MFLPYFLIYKKIAECFFLLSKCPKSSVLLRSGLPSWINFLDSQFTSIFCLFPVLLNFLLYHKIDESFFVLSSSSSKFAFYFHCSEVVWKRLTFHFKMLLCLLPLIYFYFVVSPPLYIYSQLSLSIPSLSLYLYSFSHNSHFYQGLCLLSPKFLVC